MKNVKFKEAGKWAELDTSLPQFEVAAGEEREVSAGLADVIVDAGRGEIIPAKVAEKAAAKPKSKVTPATKDKAKAESK